MSERPDRQDPVRDPGQSPVGRHARQGGPHQPRRHPSPG